MDWEGVFLLVLGALKWALFETYSKYESGSAHNVISTSVQVAFIIAGGTHAEYRRTLQHALGIRAVSEVTFLRTIASMYDDVKEMLDEVCEVGKQEMKEKNDDELGSWKRAVTVADGTWQTRGYHSKNATFTIRNYQTGALLYYEHLCQKGRDNVVEGNLYQGTSKAAEGYAARETFDRAKREGLEVAVHWQDADSSSANAVREVFPRAKIMICGGHAGRAHKKILEKRQRARSLSKALIDKYKDTFPNICEEEYQRCKCGDRHRTGCGCLTDAFINKAHTNFTSTLIEAQSQEEFVRRLQALPRHAVDDHSLCDFHPLVVCSCDKCENEDQIECEGRPYRTRFRLDCKFHALLYEIECHKRAGRVKELIHPVLKRGHSNAVEASHNVFIRFRSKDIALERLHYNLSTNLALLQANLTFMHGKFGTSYHWIPELYRRMELPVFDGVQEALESHSVQRKRALEKAKTTPEKKRRIEDKRRRARDAKRRKDWSKVHGCHTYGEVATESGHEEEGGDKPRRGNKNAAKQGKCSACGSTAHKRSTHRDCPFNKRNSSTVNSDSVVDRPDVEFASPAHSTDEELDLYSTSDLSDVDAVDLDDVYSGVVCTCGSNGRAHKRDLSHELQATWSWYSCPSSTSSSLQSKSTSSAGSESRAAHWCSSPERNQAPDEGRGSRVCPQQENGRASSPLSHCWAVWRSLSAILSKGHPDDLL